MRSRMANLRTRMELQSTEDDVGGAAPAPGPGSIAGAEEVASHVADD
jgi:hypothetical protein